MIDSYRANEQAVDPYGTVINERSNSISLSMHMNTSNAPSLDCIGQVLQNANSFKQKNAIKLIALACSLQGNMRNAIDKLSGTQANLDTLSREHDNLKSASADKIRELQGKVEALQRNVADLEVGYMLSCLAKSQKISLSHNYVAWHCAHRLIIDCWHAEETVRVPHAVYVCSWEPICYRTPARSCWTS